MVESQEKANEIISELSYKSQAPIIDQSIIIRVGTVAQYCFIIMYGVIFAVGLFANVAVLAAFATSKVAR